MFFNLLNPRLPSSAAGIDSGAAAVVQLERARGALMVKRAAAIDLPRDLIHANFDESNISDPTELVGILSNLVTSAGLLRQRKWSVSLPEATARAAIITLDSTPTSRRELDELLDWRIERSFGPPVTELRIAKELLPQDQQKQTRYLVNAIRLSVLAEYESIFAALGWHAGLVLPRHDGEVQWLRNGHQTDGLLLTAHNEGFTAVLMRGSTPFTLRSVFCDKEECDDELHRVLLFYRERSGASQETSRVDRLLVLGEGLDKNRVAEIANETLGVNLKPLDAADVGLTIPTRDLTFDAIAAPAGLAKMAW